MSYVGQRSLLPLAVGAIGIVYGDIGTSPLYAMRECFFGSHSVPPTHENVLGVLSLIIYSLLLVISLKYVAIVMRADNQGEGGILALTALLPHREPTNGRIPLLVLLGIFGAALLYGDGMITPAITVLSAMEGLTVVTTAFTPYVVPLTVVTLLGVFAIQRHGTDVVGRLFGPVMIVWFVVIAWLGVASLVDHPEVLGAVNPGHAVTFFAEHGWHGVAVLGAVVLVVTGGEALYADMGHFGKQPIRVAWFVLVLPALLLNYFGQGALMLAEPEAAANPFYLLAPEWLRLPLVGLATLAAIIASQALISGAFSITRQAVQLGYCPRLDIDHTSSHEIGQIYVPQANWALMVSTIAIVIGFGTSTEPGRGLRHRRHPDHGRHRGAAPRRGHRSLEVAGAGGVRHQRPVPHHRPDLPGRQRPQDRPGRLAAAGHRRAHLHPDDHLEDRPQRRRRAAGRGLGAARSLHGPHHRRSAGAGAGHRGLHDRAATRHAAGAGPQPALQQGAARARADAQREDAALAAGADRRTGEHAGARRRHLTR